MLLNLFNIEGVLHYGVAGNANPEIQIGDVTIPHYWAHTGLWNWQVTINISTIISLHELYHSATSKTHRFRCYENCEKKLEKIADHFRMR